MDKKDRELIQKIKAGDELALQELFLKYAPMVNATCKPFITRTIERKDLMQEALLKCYQTAMIFDFEKNDNFGGFYKMNLLNKLRTILRLNFSYKRLANMYTLSFEESGGRFSNRINENYILNNIDLEVYLENLSKLETEVLKYYMNGNYGGLINYDKVAVSRAKRRAKLKMMNYFFD